MANRRRKNVVRIYLSDDEYSKFKQRLARSGKKNISSYGLDALLNSQITSQSYIDGINLLNLKLSELQRIDRGIGTNINQIAHRVNYYDSVSRDDIQQLLSAYHSHRSEKEELWQQIKSYQAQLLHTTS